MATTRVFSEFRETLTQRFERVQRRIDRLREITDRARGGAQRVVDEVTKEAERLGLSAAPQAPVIDVGQQENPLLRLARGAGVALVIALLMSGFFSFVAFFVQFLAAILIANRVLKIRIDLAVPGAT